MISNEIYNKAKDIVIDYEQEKYFDNSVHKIKGDCHGVSFTRRGKDDNHILVTILLEDDEHW